MTLKRLLGIIIAIYLVVVGFYAYTAAFGPLIGIRVREVTTVPQVARKSGLFFPPGCQVAEGRWVTGMGGSGLWAVVKIPAKDVSSFLAQPRLKSRYAQDHAPFTWGLVVPEDDAMRRWKPRVEGIRRPIYDGGGDMYRPGGQVHVLIDQDNSAAPLLYVSWFAN